VLALYSLFVTTARGSAGEFVVNYLLTKFDFQYDIFNNELSLVPNNDRSILDNLLRYNMYRSDVVVRNTLVYLIQSLAKLVRYSTTNTVYRLFDGYLRDQLLDLKNNVLDVSDSIQYKIKLEKLLMLLEVFGCIGDASIKHFALSSQFDDQLLKAIRFVEELQSATQDSNLRLILIRLRNSILRIFETLVDCMVSMKAESTHTLGLDTPNVQTQQGLFRLSNGFIQQTTSLYPLDSNDIPVELRHEMLKSCELSLEICLASSKSLLTQTVLLYGEYVENAYRPECLINLEVLFKLLMINLGEDQSRVFRIVEMALILMVNLTQNPRVGLYNCERRKVAIKSLLGDKAGSFEETISKLPIPPAYFKYLQTYFEQPSQETRLSKDPEETKDLQEIFKQAKERKENINAKTNLDKAF
jgi:hypothetical protein